MEAAGFYCVAVRGWRGGGGGGGELEIWVRIGFLNLQHSEGLQYDNRRNGNFISISTTHTQTETFTEKRSMSQYSRDPNKQTGSSWHESVYYWRSRN
jgi:hypothetical protein